MMIIDAIRSYIAPVEQCIQAGDVFQSELSPSDLHQAFIQNVLRPMLPARSCRANLCLRVVR